MDGTIDRINTRFLRDEILDPCIILNIIFKQMIRYILSLSINHAPHMGLIFEISSRNKLFQILIISLIKTGMLNSIIFITLNIS